MTSSLQSDLVSVTRNKTRAVEMGFEKPRFKKTNKPKKSKF